MEPANLIKRNRSFMKTEIIISVVREKSAAFSTLDVIESIEKAFAEFDLVVEKYTRFNKTSELSRLNRNSGKWYPVTEEMFTLVKKLLDLATATNGAFDPTIIDFLEAYGYDSKYDFSKLDNPDLDQMIKKIAETRSSFKDIELDESNYRIKLAPGQRLDLGAIGKGYAVDLAAGRLAQYGNFMVNAGGDIYAEGFNQYSKEWTTALRPNLNQIIGNIKLHPDGSAVACSGAWARKVKQFHHLIDPSSGKPTQVNKAVFVVTTDSSAATTLADGWATAIYVSDLDKIQSVIPNNLAVATWTDGKFAATANFPELLTTQ